MDSKSIFLSLSLSLSLSLFLFLSLPPTVLLHPAFCLTCQRGSPSKPFVFPKRKSYRAVKKKNVLLKIVTQDGSELQINYTSEVVEASQSSRNAIASI
jgi:hypothetical protein